MFVSSLISAAALVAVLQGLAWAIASVWERARGAGNVSAGEGGGAQGLLARLRASREEVEKYLEGARLGWYQVIVIFFTASIVGLLAEEAWMVVSVGLVESRAGLVWGPFSPLYGTCAVYLTALSFVLRRFGARSWQVFLACAAVGGLLEQFAGWSMSVFANAESWTYLYLPDRITPWVAWRFLLMWGLLGLLWCRAVAPRLLYVVGEPAVPRQRVFEALVTVFLVVDVGMTLACFVRKTARDAGVPASSAIERWLDAAFTDEFIAERFENLRIGAEREPLDENGEPLLTEEEAIERAEAIRAGEDFLSAETGGGDE